MKNIIPILILNCCLSVFCDAQSVRKIKVPKQGVEAPKFRHELSLNMTEIVAQVFKINNDSVFQSKQRYWMGYKLFYKDWALRSGFGILYSSKQDAREGFVDVKSTTKLRYDIRLGIERQLNLSQRWVGYYGLDAIGGYNGTKVVNDSGFDKITDLTNNHYYGGGAVIGIQFNLTKRLSFMTEAQVIYKVGEESTKRYFSVSSQFDTSYGYSTFANAEFITPTSIFLVYKL